MFKTSYYGYWKRKGNTPDNPVHQEVLEAVKEIAVANDDADGSRRMKVTLNVLAYPVSRSKARKLMKETGMRVRSRKQYKVTTDSNHKLPLLDNVLNRQFEVGSWSTKSGLFRRHYLTVDSERLDVPSSRD